MRKYLLFIFSFILIIAAAVACDENISEPDNNDTFFPLAVGNKWYYNSYSHAQDFDPAKVNFIREITGKKLINSKRYFVFVTTTFDNSGAVMSKDTSYFRYTDEIVYQILNTDMNENIYALFKLKQGDKFTIKWQQFDYEITMKEKTENTATLFYNSPQMVDEEHEITFKKGYGVYKSHSTAWGWTTQLIKAEIH